MSKRGNDIRNAVLNEVFWTSRSPVEKVATHFHVTRQAVQLHVKALVNENLLIAKGERRHRRYFLSVVRRVEDRFDVSDKKLNEDDIWTRLVRPEVIDLQPEERDICQYGTTEMINNVLDHAAAKHVAVRVTRTATSIEIDISDDGEGIFQRIARALNLTDPRQSLLELSKGKFTTDPTRHTGEGIFFSSRLFDRYRIRAGSLTFFHSTRRDDWLFETKESDHLGTRVTMSLLLPSKTQMSEVFGRYSSGPEDYRFAKTHVPLRLATFDDESLISRSSAKRVLNRVDRFSEVLLDFSGVASVGQAFADEIFRVYARQHPAVVLIPINANAKVTQMIRRAQSSDEPNLFMQ